LRKLAEGIRRVGFVGNADKPACARVVSRAAQLVAATGRELAADETTGRHARLRARLYPDAGRLAREVDLLLVFGGDGTLLHVARTIAGSATPLLGINIGGLGFLTAVSSQSLASALQRVWRGEFTYERRALLEGTTGVGPTLIRCRALNDLVISHGAEPRLIELEVNVDDDPVTSYRCDGLIVSSPTGSTAYSLSAGGAVVFPTADVFAVTPICPHTLSNRSLILSLASTIAIKIRTAEPAAILSADGQNVHELSCGDTLTIRRSRRTVRLMHLAGSSFFEALRQKLHWRGATL
jgi:NAD+ kinase